nr:MAG TPA: hypothetical protein [Caudoviricetes sp.]
MHTLHWVAVEAESKEQATWIVRDFLESQMGNAYNSPSWYDWFIIGGGRWNEEDDSDLATNMVINYSENPTEFIAQLDRSLDNRMEAFNSYKERLGDNLHLLEEAIDNFQGKSIGYNPEIYSLSQMIEIMDCEWNWSAFFYDIEDSSADIVWFKEAITKDDYTNANLYLVPVDFHY